jgi:glutamate--cysteine ligase catalytic subunit
MAHLFIRDPLVVFSEIIDQDDQESNDHFENIQSTNWQTLRFKPPPPNSPIGWRVEFRSMEVQLTDFENAAYAVFITLLSRAILTFNLNFYIPISKVDANMGRAQARGASKSGKFYFRKDIYSPGSSPTSSGSSSPVDESRPKTRKLKNCFTPLEMPEDGIYRGPVEEEYEEMTIDEIMNGKSDSYPGLLGLVWAYIDTLDIEDQEFSKIRSYLDLIRRRANG